MSGFTIVVSDLHLGAPHSVLNTSTQWKPSEVDHSYSNNALKTQPREIGEAIARGVVSASRSDEDRDVRIGAIEKDLDRIRRYMELFGTPEPDVFIFGHTHISGVQRAGGTTYLNTGGWVTSGGRAPDATVVALDDRGRESFAKVNLSR